MDAYSIGGGCLCGAVRFELTAPPDVRPSFHQFVAYAAVWEPILDDGLERFPEGRPRPQF